MRIGEKKTAYTPGHLNAHHISDSINTACNQNAMGPLNKRVIEPLFTLAYTIKEPALRQEIKMNTNFCLPYRTPKVDLHSGVALSLS